MRFRIVRGADPRHLQRLLHQAEHAPSTVWAYAAATTASIRSIGPVDQILLMEDDHDDLVVLWARRPGSYTGNTRHRIHTGYTGGSEGAAYRKWSSLVHQLADRVECAAPVNDGGHAQRQSAHLRWVAAYAPLAYHCAQARDLERAHLRGGGAPSCDLGVDDPASPGLGCAPGGSEARLIPPGWDEHGWNGSGPAAAPTFGASGPPPAPHGDTAEHGGSGGGRA